MSGVRVQTIELLNLTPGHFPELHSVPCSISAGPVARCVGLWWIAIEWPNCASGAVGSIFQDSSLSSTQFPAQSMLNRRRQICWIVVDLRVGCVLDRSRKNVLKCVGCVGMC